MQQVDLPQPSPKSRAKDVSTMEGEMEICKQTLADREKELAAFKEQSVKRNAELQACREELGTLRDVTEETEQEFEICRKKLLQCQTVSINKSVEDVLDVKL